VVICGNCYLRSNIQSAITGIQFARSVTRMYIKYMVNYRIKRTDTRNITIQEKRGEIWRTLSYHGNSLNSLVSGLYELIMTQHIPEDEGLLKQLKRLEIEQSRGLERIERLVLDNLNEM